MRRDRKKVLSWVLMIALMITSLLGTGAVTVAAFEPGDIIRVNCGSEVDYIDTLGNVWLADQPYSEESGWGYVGSTSVDRPPRASETLDCTNYDVVNTEDDDLYKVQRNSVSSAEDYAADNTKPLPEFSYLFDVPNDRYKVTLKFCELYEGTEPFHFWEGAGTSPIGKRLVDIFIENNLYVDNQDLFAERNVEDPIAPVTDYVANDKIFVVEVSDGQLKIDLKSSANRPAIAAIAVEPTTDELSIPVEEGEEPPPDDEDDTTPGEAEITINEAVEYQTIDGFGGFGAEKVWWDRAPFYTQKFIDQVLGDLGITILRDHLPENFELVNDNEDPYDTDLSKYNLHQPGGNADGKLADHLDYLRAMKENGLNKLIVSIWSPPGWMKTNNDVRNGGSLKPEYYEEFAEYIVAYLRIIKQETGIDVYAISLQNELSFVEPYASCVYTPEEYKNVLKVVGKRFRDEGITTKIFGPEEMGNYYKFKEYIDAVMADPEASQYLDILACHGYQQDGITANDPGPYNWRKLSELAQAVGNRPLWMTESSGFDYLTWDGAMAHNAAIYSALKYGKASAWVFWSLNNPSPNQYSLMFDCEPSLQYYAAKHYYKYIRPGAVQIDSATSKANVAPIAFNNKDDKTITIVITNNTKAQQTVSLNYNGASLPSQFEGYLSTADAQFSPLGVVGTSAIVMPAKSIITLYGTYDSSEPVDTTAPEITLDQTGGTVTEAEYAISGSVNEPCTVKINGIAVTLGEDFRFTGIVNLTEGENLITVEATDIAGNTSIKTITLLYEAGGEEPADQALNLILDKGIVNEGSDLTITVKALGVNDLRGFDLLFKYDDELYEPADIQLAGQFGNSETAYFTKTIANGEIRMLGALYGDNNRNGDVELVKITLRAASGLNAYAEVVLAAGSEISINGNQIHSIASDIIKKAPIADPDVIGDGDGVQINDLVVVAGGFMAAAGDQNYDASYDMNKDGIIDIIDIVFVVKAILGI